MGKVRKVKNNRRVLGFQNLVVDLYFFGRDSVKLFDITLPILQFPDKRQTESRIMANAALAFSVLQNPDHPQVRGDLIEALKLIVPEERAIAFTEVLGETGREYDLNRDDAFLRMKIKLRNGKWLQAATTVKRRTIVGGEWKTIEKLTKRDYELTSDQAATELGLDVVHLNESSLPLLMESAIGENPGTLISDLLIPKGVEIAPDKRIVVPMKGETNHDTTIIGRTYSSSTVLPDTLAEQGDPVTAEGSERITPQTQREGCCE